MRERLDDVTVGYVVSSPSRRCVETVEPLARQLRTKIDTRKEFLEGADPDGALDLLLELARRDPSCAATAT